jgi:hypothetical protein
VLEHVELPIEVNEIEDDDITSATRALSNIDKKQPLRLGQALLRFAILKGPSTARIVLRVSHALYDGLSFEHIIRSLHALYNDKQLPSPPKFAQYIQHMVES